MSLVGPSFGLGDWTGQCTCSPNESPFSIAVLWSCLSFSVAGWHGWGRCSCIAPTRPCQSCQLRNYKALHGTSPICPYDSKLWAAANLPHISPSGDCQCSFPLGVLLLNRDERRLMQPAMQGNTWFFTTKLRRIIKVLWQTSKFSLRIFAPDPANTTWMCQNERLETETL